MTLSQGGKVVLRKVSFIDASKLRELSTKQLGYNVPLELTEAQLGKQIADEEHHFLLVFEDDLTKEVAGYVHAEVYESLYAAPLFNVLAFAVDDQFQRRGIGKQEKKLINFMKR